MAKLTVDVDAIHLVTGHLHTAAAEVHPDPEVTQVFDDAFESPVSDVLVATNADLLRQARAVAEYVTSLARAGDRAAAGILEVDAALSTQARPDAPRGSGPWRAQ